MITGVQALSAPPTASQHGLGATHAAAGGRPPACRAPGLARDGVRPAPQHRECRRACSVLPPGGPWCSSQQCPPSRNRSGCGGPDSQDLGSPVSLMPVGSPRYRWDVSSERRGRLDRLWGCTEPPAPASSRAFGSALSLDIPRPGGGRWCSRPGKGVTALPRAGQHDWGAGALSTTRPARLGGKRIG